MNPESILCTQTNLADFAGVQQESLKLYYDCLDLLHELNEPLIKHFCQQFEKKTDRKGPVAYYDVTTFRFESVDAGELRLFAYSKDNKHNEVQVVMGLLIDNQGTPMSYQLFSGNTMDQKALKEAVAQLKERYQMEKIVVVADRGLNGKDNLAFLVENNHDFVLSYTLKRAPDFLKAIALNGEWKSVQADENGETFYKSKMVPYSLKMKVELSEEEKKA